MDGFRSLLPDRDPESPDTGSSDWYRLVKGGPCIGILSD